MSGEKENVQISDNGQVLLVNRGRKGAAIVNIGTLSNVVDLPTELPSGTYRDKVHGKTFVVKNGRIKGLAGPERSYIITK